MKKRFVFVIITIIIYTISGCKEKEIAVATEQSSLATFDKNLISVSEVELRSTSDNLLLNGKITFESENVVEILPMFGGNVLEVRCELGDYVRKGDILAVIRSSEVAEFQKEEREANATILVAQRNYSKVKDMFDGGLASEAELTEAQAELENAKAQLEKIKEVISIYNIRNSSEYVIKAPISGFVVGKNITREMQLRSDSDKEIFVISKLDDVWVLADVYEGDIGKVKVGSAVEIRVPAYPDIKFNTSVERIYNVLAEESNTLTIRMKLKNDSYLLKPGMFTKVYVQCESGRERYPSIEESGLIFDNNKYFAIVLNGDAFEIREIEPISVGGSPYISTRSGLSVGERVVVKNALLLYNEIKR